MQFLTNFDTGLFFFINNLADQSAWGNALIIFCAEYAAYLLPLTLIVLVATSRMPRVRHVSLVSVALLSAALSRGVLTPLIRFFYYHPRPFDVYSVHQLIPESGASFPSGHAMFFFALAAAVYFYNKQWGVWFFLATLLMCVARVAAGVHFPSDILGGMVLGSAVAYVTHRYLRQSVERIVARVV